MPASIKAFCTFTCSLSAHLDVHLSASVISYLPEKTTEVCGSSTPTANCEGLSQIWRRTIFLNAKLPMCSVILTLQHGSCTNYNHGYICRTVPRVPAVSFVAHAACVPLKDLEINGIVMCIWFHCLSAVRGLERFPNFTRACIYNSQGQ